MQRIVNVLAPRRVHQTHSSMTHMAFITHTQRTQSPDMQRIINVLAPRRVHRTHSNVAQVCAARLQYVLLIYVPWQCRNTLMNSRGERARVYVVFDQDHLLHAFA